MRSRSGISSSALLSALAGGMEEVEEIALAPYLREDEEPARDPRLGPHSDDRKIQKKIDRCAADIFYWLEHYGWMVQPKKLDEDSRVHQFKLWPGQRVLIERLLDGYRKADNRMVNKSRELGVSWLCVHLLVYLWIFERNFQALMLSKEGESVDDGTHESLMGKARFILYRQPDWLVPEDGWKTRQSPTSIIENLLNGSKITGKPSSETAGRSTRQAIVFSDEWAHVSHRKQRKIRLALQSVSRTWWRVSTPGGRGDDFHLSWTRAAKTQRILLQWQTNPERLTLKIRRGRRLVSWWDSLLNENGGDLTKDERSQEFGCSFGAVLGERVFQFERTQNAHSAHTLTVKRRKLLPCVASMDFGTGPSWTCILFALIDWDDSLGVYPRIYLDSEIMWTRAPAGLVAKDIIRHHSARGYTMSASFIGDPSGNDPESDQGSWQTRLQANGIPIRCLPHEFNTHQVLYVDSIDHVQEMLNLGCLTFDPALLPYATESAESWEWDIPEGIDSRFLNRATIRPKKDGWSHFMNALQYLIEYILRTGKVGVGADVIAQLQKAKPTTVSQVLDRIRR